ncbi:Putative oxidoreductase [Bacillus thuringiensis MC28]|nr:Putative oxidoreductase [Bacillus thuringiensis MC28]
MMKLNLSQRNIKECLELATRRGEHVLTNRYQRMIGKTTALIEFAKENNYIAIVNCDAIANELRFEFNYEKIIGIDRHHRLHKLSEDSNAIVFDECCKPEQIEQLVNLGFKVITGFVNDKHSESITTSDGQRNGQAIRKFFDMLDKPEPLLTITLTDIDSNPVIHYKGEQIDRKLRVAFDWEAQSIDKINRTYIHIEHVASDNKRCNTEIIQHNHPIVKEEVEFYYGDGR